MNKLLIGLMLGVLLGCIIVLYSAFFDTLLFDKKNKNFKIYLIASVWELLFFVLGIGVGVIYATFI